MPQLAAVSIYQESNTYSRKIICVFFTASRSIAASIALEIESSSGWGGYVGGDYKRKEICQAKVNM